MLCLLNIPINCSKITVKALHIFSRLSPPSSPHFPKCLPLSIITIGTVGRTSMGFWNETKIHSILKHKLIFLITFVIVSLCWSSKTDISTVANDRSWTSTSMEAWCSVLVDTIICTLDGKLLGNQYKTFRKNIRRQSFIFFVAVMEATKKCHHGDFLRRHLPGLRGNSVFIPECTRIPQPQLRFLAGRSMVAFSSPKMDIIFARNFDQQSRISLYDFFRAKQLSLSTLVITTAKAMKTNADLI